MPPEQIPSNPLPPSGPYVAPPLTPAPKRSAGRLVFSPFLWLWAHMGHFARVRLIVLLAVVVLGTGLALIDGPHHRTQPPAYTTNSSSSSTSFTSPRQLSIACGNHGQAIKGNDKYRSGSAPYHVVIFEQSQYYQTTQYDYSFPADAITDPIVGPAIRPASPSATQLVACIDRTAQASTGKSCAYQPVNLPIYSATYQVTVYEAATHRVVLRAPVSSMPLNTVRDNCPVQAEYNPKDPRIYYPVDGYSLAAALKSVVQ